MTADHMTLYRHFALLCKKVPRLKTVFYCIIIFSVLTSQNNAFNFSKSPLNPSILVQQKAYLVFIHKTIGIYMFQTKLHIFIIKAFRKFENMDVFLGSF